jgi:hypothetical protein
MLEHVGFALELFIVGHKAFHRSESFKLLTVGYDVKDTDRYS